MPAAPPPADGRTYHDLWQLNYPPIERTDEITVTLSPGSDRLSFTARRTIIDSQEPDAVRTRTTTISADDVPTLFTGFGYETMIPGAGICSYLAVDVEETNTATSCVKVLDVVECREASGIVVTIH